MIKLRKYGGFSTDKRPIYTTTPTVFIDGYANHVDKTSNFEYSTSPLIWLNLNLIAEAAQL